MAATYKSQILARFDWPRIERDARGEALDHDEVVPLYGNEQGCDQEGHVGSCYLGSVMSIYPSGKFYTAWTTNQTRSDEDRDERFNRALTAVGDKYHGYIQSGEGDPTDLYFCAYVTNEEIAKLREEQA